MCIFEHSTAAAGLMVVIDFGRFLSIEQFTAIHIYQMTMRSVWKKRDKKKFNKNYTINQLDKSPIYIPNWYIRIINDFTVTIPCAQMIWFVDNADWNAWTMQIKWWCTGLHSIRFEGKAFCSIDFDMIQIRLEKREREREWIIPNKTHP